MSVKDFILKKAAGNTKGMPVKKMPTNLPSPKPQKTKMEPSMDGSKGLRAMAKKKLEAMGG